MTKKTVTAPLTYDPGKGRQKEHLAYLNYQEMQALKRLNGNNQERGPKGLPSFPPADAKGSSSKASSSTGARGPTGPQGQARSSPAGNKGGAPGSVSRTSTASKTTTGARGPTGPQGQARTSPAGGSPGAVSRPSGLAGIGGGGGGARDSGQAATRNVTTSRSVTPSRAPSIPSGGGGRDSGTIRQAQDARTKAAEKTPALKDDRSRTLNVGPMGTPVQVRAQPGARISGAIRQAQAPAVRPTTPMATQGTSFASPLDARIENTFRISDARRASDQFRFSEVPSVAEIAADNARRLNAAKMAQQYSQYRSPPGMPAVDFTGANSPFADTSVTEYRVPGMTTYPSAPQGVYGPRAGVGSGYLRTAEIPGMITTGMPSRLSGMPGPRGSAEATLRAYEEAKRIANAKPIQDRLSQKFYGAEDRVPAEPRLSVGRSAIAPTVAAPQRGKLYSDRITPEYTRISMDPTRPDVVRQKQIYDRIAPERVGDLSMGVPVVTDPRVSLPPSAYPAAQERILEIENLLSDRGVRKPITRFSGQEQVFPTPSGIPSDVTNEMLPGAGIDVTNIPRYPAELASSTPSEAGVRSIPVFSDAGVMKPVPGFVPRAQVVNPVTGKIYTDPVADRIPYTPTTGALVPSLSVGTPAGTTVYKITEGLPPAPPLPGEPNGLNTRYSVSGGQGIVALSPQTPQDTYRAGIVSDISGLTTAERDAIYGVPASPVPKPTPRPVREVDSGADLEDTATGVPGDETPSTDYTDEGPAPVDESELATPDKPGEELTQEQEQKLKETLKRGGLGIRIGAGVIGVAGVPLAGLAGGYLSRQYQKNKIEQIKQYAAMTDAQKAAAEKKNPELVGWAHRLGIDSVNDYDFYQSWADKAGLRAPPSREGGGRDTGGIYGIPVDSGDSDVSAGGGDSGSDSASGGRRPDIYYMWDLGVNIPSPGAPNYTQYQTYLAERLAAQQAMGYI